MSIPGNGLVVACECTRFKEPRARGFRGKVCYVYEAFFRSGSFLPVQLRPQSHTTGVSSEECQVRRTADLVVRTVQNVCSHIPLGRQAAALLTDAPRVAAAVAPLSRLCRNLAFARYSR